MGEVILTLEEKYPSKFLINAETDHYHFFGWEKVPKKENQFLMNISPWNLLDLNKNSKQFGFKVLYDDSILPIIEEQRLIYKRYNDANKYRNMPIDEINDIWEENEFEILFPKIKALDNQKRMTLWLLDTKKAGCYTEQGTGKSIIGILTLGKLLAEGKIKKPLIVAPASLLCDTAWFEEINRFSEYKITNLRDGDSLYDNDGDISFVNPEKFNYWCFKKTAKGERSYDKDNFFKMMGYDSIFFDESSQLKNFSSSKTQGFLNVADGLDYLYFSSGTPAPNKIFQIFSQMYLIGSVLGDSNDAFQQRYGVKKDCGPTKVYFPLPTAEAQISERIKLVSYFVKQEECFTLPKHHIENVEIDLHPEHMKIYKKVEKDYICNITGLDDFGNTLEGKAKVEYDFTLRMKLLQILNGFVTIEDEDGKKRRVILEWNAKLDKLKEMLDEIVSDPNRYAIVWCRFRWEIQTFYKMYKDVSTFVYGGMTDSARNDHLIYWKNNPLCKIIFAMPKSVKYGHTWLKATDTIFYSATEDYDDFAQARYRNKRYGLDHEIYEWRFVTKNTVERKVWYALTQRRNLDDFLKSYYKRNLSA